MLQEVLDALLAVSVGQVTYVSPRLCRVTVDGNLYAVSQFALEKVTVWHVKAPAYWMDIARGVSPSDAVAVICSHAAYSGGRP